MTTTSQFAGMTLSSNFFEVTLFLMSSLVTGSSFMLISLLVLQLWQFSFKMNWSDIQKLEIPPSEFFSNIRRLCRDRDTKFVTDVSNEMLLNTEKCQRYSFYRFWVTKGKPTAEGGGAGGAGGGCRERELLLLPPRSGLNYNQLQSTSRSFYHCLNKVIY